MEEPLLSRRLITVEPVVFLLESIQGMLVNLRTEYVEYRLAEQRNFTLPNVGSANSTCTLNDTLNSTSGEIQKDIEAHTAIWILYLKDTSVFIPIFTVTILAAASDFIGRRPIFLIGSICHMLASTLFLLITIFNLPLWLLVCAEAILGLGGDSVLVGVVALAYIVDVYHNENEQKFRLVVTAMMIYLAYGVSQMVIGKILQSTHSFVFAFSCAVGIGILNLSYVCTPYFIPETVTNTGVPRDLVKQIILKYFKLFKNNTRIKNRFALISLFISDFFYYFVHEAIFIVITIYGIAAPFCWTPMETGIYAAMVNTVPALCTLVAVKVLSRCMNNFWMLHVSLLSAISELLVSAWAQTSAVLMFAAPATGFIRTLAEGIYKAQLSTLVNPDEQGVLFGFQALVASLGRVCSPLVMNTTYAAFVRIDMPTLTFYMAAALLGIPMFLNALVQITTHRRETAQDVEDAPLLKDEPVTEEESSIN